MDDYLLFQLIKQLVLELDPDYSVRFRDVKANKRNEVGVFIKGGSSNNRNRLIGTGKYLNHHARAQLIIQSGDSEDSVFKALNLKSNLRKSIEGAFNKIYKVKVPVKNIDGVILYDKNYPIREVEVNIIRVDLLGDPDFKGYTNQGLPLEDINFKIEYYIGGIS